MGVKTRMKTGLVWSAADLDRLVELKESGVSWVDIGKELKRMPSACSVKYYAERYEANVDTHESNIRGFNALANAESMWGIALAGRRFDDPGMTVITHSTGRVKKYSAQPIRSLYGCAAAMCAR